MLTSFRRIAAPVAVIACLWAASAARADTVTVIYNIAGPTDLGGGVYQHHYAAEISLSGEMHVGDFFTVYDIGGYLGNSAMTGFTSSTQAFGTGVAGDGVVTAALTTTDDGRTNLTYVATSDAASGFYFFDIFSSFSTVTLDSFVGRDHKLPLAGGTINTNYGSVEVPNAVPLPAAAWAGMALFGVLGGVKLRRSRQSALA